ncbi:hypothetical protein KIH77_08750 [Bifidobacterium sp. 82T24]|uniref:hypothetical protein n=1 Tax=Bifidobacterium pluvialisilvae TaxID=2834436 RepID=UPI001C58DF30|nr:hypothetical protein [Bifidobacterium pluvialisilvae]MBW3088810.1 hypothetical protein [Bifidobacterium pluvialisilvae]
MTGPGSRSARRRRRGECSHCHELLPLKTVRTPLCDRCWRFLHGVSRSWHGTCRRCGAQTTFYEDDDLCDGCDADIRLGTADPVDLDDPDTRRLIQSMRRTTDPGIRARYRDDPMLE